MRKNNPLVDTIYENIKYGIDKEVLHLVSHHEEEKVDGRKLFIKNTPMINFSSYSYLGLETDQRLKDKGIEMLNQYGSQFGSSRAYVSIDLYEKLEYLLGEIFSAATIVAPSTTLAHQAALPVIINDDDAVILDQQVHASIKTTISMLKVRGIPVEILRHNRLDLLEGRIKQLKRKYKRIWYMLDSVYSMYGDFAPLKGLEKLMNDHDQFHIYVDDAHGMSWAGKNGKGYALNEIDLHLQMVLVSSLNKAYAGAGGVIVFPNAEFHHKVSVCGGTLIFSTPVQPPMMGINIASAQIHLSEGILPLQEDIAAKIAYCHKAIVQQNLPDISDKNSPIFYVGTISPQISFKVVARMMQDGFYVSSAIFPAVSMKRAGLRFCINVNLTYEDIDAMIHALSHHFYQVLKEENLGVSTIADRFKLQDFKAEPYLIRSTSAGFELTEYQSIQEINMNEWNEMFKYKGSFDWNGLVFLEEVFSNNPDKENCWEFHYYIVRDEFGKAISATFCTVSWGKDDIFSHPTISEKIAEERELNRYYLCSKIVMMGSPITEGSHLYLDKEVRNWNEPASVLLKAIMKLQQNVNADQLILRDFDRDDILLKELFLSEGFISTELPNANIIEGERLKWNSVDEYLTKISANSRKKLKQNATRYEKYYEVEIVASASEQEIDQWYNLYLGVQRGGHELSTFPVPKEFFRKALVDPNWEVLKLSIKREYMESDMPTIAAIGLIYKTETTFSPMILGLEYKYLYSFKNYRQAIFQLVKRANALKLDKIYMGFTADIEKRNFGAVASPKVAYLMVNDQFNLDVLANMNSLVEST